MYSRTIKDDDQTFVYNGHLMTNADGNSLTWDENGQLTAGINSKTFTWNWDGLLRSANYGGYTVNIRYDPSGNRIWRQTVYSPGSTTTRKYIIDAVGDLPTILLERDGSDVIQRTYIYANGEVLMQHYGAPATNNKCFYLHDRLGSVRQIINTSGVVYAYYTYSPFGEVVESSTGPFTGQNRFRFAGQWEDSEIGQYYLRARQYDPYLGIFTARDPVDGDFEEPLTLHKYLYCLNDPINRIDTGGYSSRSIAKGIPQ